MGKRAIFFPNWTIISKRYIFRFGKGDGNNEEMSTSWSQSNKPRVHHKADVQRQTSSHTYGEIRGINEFIWVVGENPGRTCAGTKVHIVQSMHLFTAS